MRGFHNFPAIDKSDLTPESRHCRPLSPCPVIFPDRHSYCHNPFCFNHRPTSASGCYSWKLSLSQVYYPPDRESTPMESTLSPLLRLTLGEACWTCQEHLRACDAGLPREPQDSPYPTLSSRGCVKCLLLIITAIGCRTCIEHGSTCSGYGSKLSLTHTGLKSKRQSGHTLRSPSMTGQLAPVQDMPILTAFHPLPVEQSYFAQHFSRA
jgi:hypothetical protein